MWCDFDKPGRKTSQQLPLQLIYNNKTRLIVKEHDIAYFMKIFCNFYVDYWEKNTRVSLTRAFLTFVGTYTVQTVDGWQAKTTECRQCSCPIIRALQWFATLTCWCWVNYALHLKRSWPMYPFASMKTHRHTDHKLSNILYSNVHLKKCIICCILP